MTRWISGELTEVLVHFETTCHYFHVMNDQGLFSVDERQESSTWCHTLVIFDAMSTRTYLTYLAFAPPTWILGQVSSGSSLSWALELSGVTAEYCADW